MERDEWNRIWGGGGHGHDHDHEHDHGHHHDGHDGDSAAHHHGHDGPDRLLVQAIAGLGTGRALELGCGMGQNAIWLAERGWQVRAADFSDVAIEQAKAAATQAKVDVDFIVADLIEDRLDGSYDLVTLFYVHLPVPDRQAMLKRVAKLVAPGGRLLFVGHDSSDPDWFEQHLRARHDHEHDSAPEHGHHREADAGEAGLPGPSVEDLVARLTSPAEIAAELVGLEIERAEVVHHDPHCAGEETGTTFVLARRKPTA